MTNTIRHFEDIKPVHKASNMPNMGAPAKETKPTIDGINAPAKEAEPTINNTAIPAKEAEPIVEKPKAISPERKKTTRKNKAPADVIKNITNIKKPLNSKRTAYGICIVASVLLVIVVAVFLFKHFSQPVLSDKYFVSDNTKAVISLESDNASNSSSAKTHLVYTYDGDKVTSLKTYFEYIDAESAKIAFDLVKTQPEFKGAELRDRYIIVTASEDQFRGLTASDVKQQVEAIRQFKSQNQEE